MAKQPKTDDSSAKSSETAPEPKRRGRPPLPPERRKQRVKGEVIHLYPTKGDAVEQALGRAIELRASYGVPGSRQARMALREWMPIAQGGAMDAFRIMDLRPTMVKLEGADWLDKLGGKDYQPEILHCYETVADSEDEGPTDKEVFAFLDHLFNNFGVSKSHSLKAALSMHLSRVLNSPMRTTKG